jgi:hypothetical protein
MDVVIAPELSQTVENERSEGSSCIPASNRNLGFHNNVLEYDLCRTRNYTSFSPHHTGPELPCSQLDDLITSIEDAVTSRSGVCHTMSLLQLSKEKYVFMCPDVSYVVSQVHSLQASFALLDQLSHSSVEVRVFVSYFLRERFPRATFRF